MNIYYKINITDKTLWCLCQNRSKITEITTNKLGQMGVIENLILIFKKPLGAKEFYFKRYKQISVLD